MFVAMQYAEAALPHALLVQQLQLRCEQSGDAEQGLPCIRGNCSMTVPSRLMSRPIVLARKYAEAPLPPNINGSAHAILG